jgi:DNA-binding CsgD family transcriptional regulator
LCTENGPDGDNEPQVIDGIGRLDQLSPKELEVLRLFTGGMSVLQISEKFQRSRKTVSGQKKSAMKTGRKRTRTVSLARPTALMPSLILYRAFTGPFLSQLYRFARCFVSDWVNISQCSRKMID